MISINIRFHRMFTNVYTYYQILVFKEQVYIPVMPGFMTYILIYSWNVLVPKMWTLLPPTVLKLIYRSLSHMQLSQEDTINQYDTSLLNINTDDKLETTVKQVLVLI